jgi:hypothetical protein
MQKLFAAHKLPPEQSICFIAPMPKEEFFDLQADPHSLHNLAPDVPAAHRTAFQNMQKKLDAWVAETDDRVPDNPTPDKYDRQTGKLPERP